jgi:hypothetical protein
MTRVFLLSAIVLGAAGCGGDAVNFCINLAKASCHVQYNCCTAAERDQFFGQRDLAIGPYSDEGGCVDAETRQCNETAQSQDEAIGEKRLTFDSAKASKCVDDITKAADKCDANSFFNEDANCARLFQGAVDDGGKCTSDQECKNLGSHCVVDQKPNTDGTVTISIEGTCKGQGDAGEQCFPGGQCKQGLRCVNDPTTGQQLCQPPAAAGDPCTQDTDCQTGLRCSEDATLTRRCAAPGDVGASCSQDSDCKTNLKCLQNSTDQLVCSVPGVAQTPCNSNDDCGANLVCAQPSQNTFSDLCEPIATAGQPCPSGVNECAPGLECRSDPSTGVQSCFAGAQGDPCDSSSRCQTGLACRNDPIAGTQKCLPALQLNASCSPFDSNPLDCASTLRCRQNASSQDVCQAPLTPGTVCVVESSSTDPCDDTHQCLFDATTSNNTCQPRIAAGSSCISNNTGCTAGTFCDQFNTDNCVALKSSGASCNSTPECSANLTCRENDANSGDVCRPISTEGGGCQSITDCDVGLDCRSDDTGAHTVCRGVSAEGGRCTSPAQCATGLDCRLDDTGSTTICRKQSSEGGRCANVIDCSSGLACKQDPTTGQLACLGPAVAGDPCSQDADCDTDLVCRTDPTTGQQKCRALGNINDACTQDQDCTAGLRCRSLNPTATSEACTNLLDDGSPCNADSDCLHGACDATSGVCGQAPPKEDFQVCNGL